MVTVEMVDCRRVVEVTVTSRHVVSWFRNCDRRTLVVVVLYQRRRSVVVRLVVPVVAHK